MVIFTPRTEQFSAIIELYDIFSLLNWTQTNTHWTCWFHGQIEQSRLSNTYSCFNFELKHLMNRTLFPRNDPYRSQIPRQKSEVGKPVCRLQEIYVVVWAVRLKWRVSKRNLFHKYTGTFFWWTSSAVWLVRLRIFETIFPPFWRGTTHQITEIVLHFVKQTKQFFQNSHRICIIHFYQCFVKEFDKWYLYQRSHAFLRYT